MSGDSPDEFSEMTEGQHWSLGILGILLSLIYGSALTLTIINFRQVKGRLHTKVLLRTQVLMILIESFRLLSVILCVVQLAKSSDLLCVTFDIAIEFSQFLSVIFAMAQCIHISNVILHLQSEQNPSQSAVYDQKQHRLRFLSQALIAVIATISVTFAIIEITFHVKAQGSDAAHNEQALRNLHQVMYAVQAFFFVFACSTLIYLYRILVNLFEQANMRREQIFDTKKKLQVIIIAYGCMAAFNIVLLVLRSFLDMDFATIISELLANFCLDVFTIGLTLYLNLKMSRQYTLLQKSKEKMSKQVADSSKSDSSSIKTKVSPNRPNSQLISGQSATGSDQAGSDYTKLKKRQQEHTSTNIIFNCTAVLDSESEDSNAELNAVLQSFYHKHMQRPQRTSKQGQQLTNNSNCSDKLSVSSSLNDKQYVKAKGNSVGHIRLEDSREEDSSSALLGYADREPGRVISQQFAKGKLKMPRDRTNTLKVAQENAIMEQPGEETEQECTDGHQTNSNHLAMTNGARQISAPVPSGIEWNGSQEQ